MLATKAFGMGINISDIVDVYHFAPTGNLADYVQEVGRAARKLDKGYAVTDYLPTDMRYARTLWGLSGIKHYQIKAIMKKLYSLYVQSGHKHLLVSPETFSYLFDSNNIDSKVKSGLMLLSADLLNKYHFPVINVRPKSLFSKQFVIVPTIIEEAFNNKYDKYCVLMNDNHVQKKLPRNKFIGEERDSKVGNIYEINLGQLWQSKFSNLTFADFKREFFSGDLFELNKDNYHVIATTKLVITYTNGYDNIAQTFIKLSSAIQNTFNDLKREFGGRNFTLTDFIKHFNNNYAGKIRREYASMLLDLFCYEHIDSYKTPSEEWKFIERQKKQNSTGLYDVLYCIRTQKYSYIAPNLQRYFKQSSPNDGTDSRYITYLPIQKSNGNFQTLMASILQLFDFASFEFIGGRNPEIFIRINDAIKLRTLAESPQYSNNILKDIKMRQNRAVAIMSSFMSKDFTSAERWNIIENYFLGNDDKINSILGLQ